MISFNILVRKSGKVKGHLELCQLVLLNDSASKLSKASGDPIYHLSTPIIDNLILVLRKIWWNVVQSLRTDIMWRQSQSPKTIGLKLAVEKGWGVCFFFSNVTLFSFTMLSISARLCFTCKSESILKPRIAFETKLRRTHTQFNFIDLTLSSESLVSAILNLPLPSWTRSSVDRDSPGVQITMYTEHVFDGQVIVTMVTGSSYDKDAEANRPETDIPQA